MTVVVEPAAQEDIADAAVWYEQQSAGLGFEFTRVVDAALSEIGRNPLQFPEVHRDAHRALLRRFPYAVVFIVRDQSVHVIACQHQRRHPVNWQRRVTE